LEYKDLIAKYNDKTTQVGRLNRQTTVVMALLPERKARR